MISITEPIYQSLIAFSIIEVNYREGGAAKKIADFSPEWE